jgi:NAD(P)-dependent dehydrogenase (short-subunit alcohol dehydrogenase family)
VAKAGVNQITQFLAPHKIRVNAILPGFFPAEQNRKVLTPERVASILNHTPSALSKTDPPMLFKMTQQL